MNSNSAARSFIAIFLAALAIKRLIGMQVGLGSSAVVSMVGTLVGAAVFALLAVKIHTRPLGWALGTGIYLAVCLFLQAALWTMGLQRLRETIPDYHPDFVSFLLFESFGTVAVLLCFYIRFSMTGPNQSTDPTP